MPELNALDGAVMNVGVDPNGNQGGLAMDFGTGTAGLSQSDYNAMVTDLGIIEVLGKDPGWSPAAVQSVYDRDGTPVGMIQTPSGVPKGMSVSQLIHQYGFFARRNGIGGISLYGPNGQFVGNLMSTNLQSMTLGGYQMTAQIATLPDGGALVGIPLALGTQLVGFADTGGGVGYIQPAQMPCQPGLTTCASGAYVADYVNLDKFWQNGPSYFVQYCFGGHDGLYSWNAGNRITPYSPGAGASFTGGLITAPQMLLMGVTAGGYCILYGENDPWNIIDPNTGQLAVIVAWVQVMAYDGSRQFSANASWGYKGAQPTDTMTVYNYVNPNTDPAYFNGGPQ